MIQLLLISPANDFCERWFQRRPSWQHRSGDGFDKRQYDVEPIDDDLAKRFVEYHHYSGSYVASRLRYSVFSRNPTQLAGVAMLSIPVSRQVLTRPFPDLVPYLESLELRRFVLVRSGPG